MRTLTARGSALSLAIGLASCFFYAGMAPAALAQTATGRLRVYGFVQASYHVEIQEAGYRSIGQGIAEGSSLRAFVVPGRATVRVVKSNSRSATYTLVMNGGESEVRTQNLPYDTLVNVVIPESKSGAPLIISVLPD